MTRHPPRSQVFHFGDNSVSNVFNTCLLGTIVFSSRDGRSCAPQAVSTSQQAFSMSALVAVVTRDHRRSYLINHPQGEGNGHWAGWCPTSYAHTCWCLGSWVQPIVLLCSMLLQGPLARASLEWMHFLPKTVPYLLSPQVTHKDQLVVCHSLVLMPPLGHCYLL